MHQCNLIAIDLAKTVFQVCKMSRRGKIHSNRSMSRAKLIQWLPTQQLSLVAMESCGGSLVTGGDWPRRQDMN